MATHEKDSNLRVEVLEAYAFPQTTTWLALHQDYSCDPVADIPFEMRDTEENYGPRVINNLLKGGRGHFGCYTDDTDVLTSTGWKPWPEVTEGDQLLAVDTQSWDSWFEKPSALQKLWCNESVYEVTGNRVNFKVTWDHRMVMQTRTNAGWSATRVVSAETAHRTAVRYRLTSQIKEKSEVPEWANEATMKLAGFWFGDGVVSHNKNPETTRFRLRKKRKIEFLNSLGFNFEPMASDRFSANLGELSTELEGNFSVGPSNKKVPLWLLTASKELVDAFLEGLRNSDGTHCKQNGSFHFGGTSKESLELIQAICVTHGYSCSMRLDYAAENVNHKDCWQLCISPKEFARVEYVHKGREGGLKVSTDTYEGYVYCATVSTGALMVRRGGKVMVSGNCLEHSHITANVIGFPHSTMQQLRTHRVGVSFDVMSLRYTSQMFLDVAEGLRKVDEVFYLRPPGEYTDRKGAKYFYPVEERQRDIQYCFEAAKRYQRRLHMGYSEEHARGFMPFDFRQHFVLTCNARSLMHLLDLRWKADAQLECQWFCDLLFEVFEDWTPALAEWYAKNRAKKARLAP